MFVPVCLAFFAIFSFQVSASGLNQKLLVISFDGFRQKYFDNNRFLPAFAEFRRNGVYSDQVQSIFPSETYPNHYAIATGMYAESHGIVANSFYDPSFNETFKKSDLDAKWWSQAEPIWITALKQGKRTAVSFWPGAAVTYPGGWRSTYYDIYDTSNLLEKRINETVHHLAYDNVDLALIYMYQPDVNGHTFGAPSEQVDLQLSILDDYLYYLQERLVAVGLGPDAVNVIVCADHGMTNITKRIMLNNLVDLDLIERIPSYGPITNFQVKQGYLDTVISQLADEAAASGDFAVYRKEDLPAEYHYSNNDRILDVVIECSFGTDMSPGEPTKLAAGTHGYNPSWPDMKPMFLARGPAFKKGGYRAKESFRTKDIYAIMAYIIGIEPLQTNATLENAMDIFEPSTNNSEAFTGSMLLVFIASLVLKFVE